MQRLLKIKKELEQKQKQKQKQVDIPTEYELLNMITNIYNYKLNYSYMLALDKITDNENTTAPIIELCKRYWGHLQVIMSELEQTLYNHITNGTYRFNIQILSKYISQTINKKLKIHVNNSISALSLLGLNIFTQIEIQKTLQALYDIDKNITHTIAINPNVFITQIVSTKNPIAKLYCKMIMQITKNYYFTNASNKTIDNITPLNNFIFYNIKKYKENQKQ